MRHDPIRAEGCETFYVPGLGVHRDGQAKFAVCGQSIDQGCLRPVHRWIGVPVRSLSTPGGVWTVRANSQCVYPVARSAGEKFPMTMGACQVFCVSQVVLVIGMG